MAKYVVLNKQDEMQQRGTNKCHWMRWMKRAHLLPSLTDGWSDVSQKNGHVKDTSPRLLTWHACQGYQIVRGKDGSRTKKKKEGIVLSQAGRARHVAEPSVRSTHRDCFVCATVC